MNKPVLPMSSLSIKLPAADRKIENYRLAASRSFPAKLTGSLNRVAFSAAHVVDTVADAQSAKDDVFHATRDRLDAERAVAGGFETEQQSQQEQR